MGFFGGTVGASRSLFFTFLISIFLVTSVSSRAAGVEPKQRSCAYRIAHAVAVGVIALSLGVPMVATSVGRVSEAPHVGLGIYFDWENVQSRLGPDLVKALNDPARDDQKFIRDLSQHMAKGLNFETEVLPFVHPRMASEYIGRINGPPVSCKHKSLVTAAVLKKAGIRAEIKWGTVDVNADDRPANAPAEEAKHVWLYLPDYHVVVDPTQGWVINADDYQDKYVLSENPGDFSWVAKTVGLLIR